MSLQPLSVEDINTAIITQIEANIADTIPLLPQAFVRVVSKAIAAVVVLLYKYCSFIFLQLFVSTASDQPTTIDDRIVTPLTEWGRLVGAGDPIPAVAAELTVDITVTNITGGTIPSGTPLVYQPTGVVYLTTADVLKDAATKSVNIEASSDQAGGGGLGSIGNLENGAAVSFANPIPDVLRDAIVTATVTQGEDAEETSVYRQRVIDRFQKRPQGGALADYEIWAEEAAGIINAYPYLGAPGIVDVYCEADPVSSGSPDGFPTPAQLTAALDSINLDVAGRATRRPANALARTFSITRKEYEVDVIGLDAPDPASAQTAITDALETLFASFEPFIGGLTVTPRDRVTAAEVSGVVFDVAQAEQATFSGVILRTSVDSEQSFGTAVGASSDDASETAGTVTLNGAVLAIVPANTLGVRFTNVNVPVGATIVSATLTLTASSLKNVYSTFTVEGEATANASTFAVSVNNISGRSRTVNSTSIIPDIWNVDDENTVDVKAIVEEVIGISGWAALNSMAFIITSTGSTDREFRSWDDDPAKAAMLDITYIFPSTALSAVEVSTLGIGEKAKVTTVAFP